MAQKSASGKRRGLKLLVVGILLGAGALYGAHWSLRATSTTGFCVSCHSMEQPKLEWQGSKHFSNKYGIQAGCADCHIPHDSDWNYAWTKATTGLQDVFAEMRGGMPDKAAFEAKRGELAKQVWARMKADDSATCRQCHTPGAMDLFAQSEKAAERHRAARESGETCIDCHRGIAHFPPEFTEGANEAAKHLSELAAHTPTDAKALYPVARLPLYADKDKAVEIANILPTAAMQVTGADGNMRAVTISGYQQEGAAQVIYAQSGKRIISAIVAEDAIDRLQNGDYSTDAETGSQWRPVTLTAWVENANLLADAQPLWDYGNALNNAYCGGCHAVVPAGHFTANQWPSIVNGMVSRTSMDDAGKLMLTYYLQNHAKDVKGGQP